MKTPCVIVRWGAMGLLLSIFGCESHTLPAEKPKTEVDSVRTRSKRSMRTEQEVLAQTVTGKEIYTAYCINCHRKDGGGFHGPPTNLKASKLDSIGIREVVDLGRPSKGMQQYGDLLKPSEIDSVVVFVLGFQRLDQ
jgi:mono/diheme cytochrome c family protein